MNDPNDRALAWARPPTRALILSWADSTGVDIANEEADDLVRRFHDAAIPFDGSPEVVERCVTDAIHFIADRLDDNLAAAGSLREAAARVSDAFVAAGLVEQPRCLYPGAPNMDRRSPSGTTASNEEESVQPLADSAAHDAPERPFRRDLIFAKAVRIRLLNGSRATVRHPPFDGRVRLSGPLPGRQSRYVSVDDLTERSRAALRAKVRRRVEVHVRCSRRSCGQAFRGWLTEQHTVENTNGEVVCSHADLFTGLCPEHRRAE